MVFFNSIFNSMRCLKIVRLDLVCIRHKHDYARQDRECIMLVGVKIISVVTLSTGKSSVGSVCVCVCVCVRVCDGIASLLPVMEYIGQRALQWG